MAVPDWIVPETQDILYANGQGYTKFPILQNRISGKTVRKEAKRK